MSMVSPDDENERGSFKMPREEYYEDDYHDDIPDAEFFNIYGDVEDYFLNSYSYDGDEIIVERES